MLSKHLTNPFSPFSPAVDDNIFLPAKVTTGNCRRSPFLLVSNIPVFIPPQNDIFLLCHTLTQGSVLADGPTPPRVFFSINNSLDMAQLYTGKTHCLFSFRFLMGPSTSCSGDLSFISMIFRVSPHHRGRSVTTPSTPLEASPFTDEFPFKMGECSSFLSIPVVPNWFSNIPDLCKKFFETKGNSCKAPLGVPGWKGPQEVT